jgi:carboxypeptidase family protein
MIFSNLDRTSGKRIKLTSFMSLQFKSALIFLAFVTLGWRSSCLAQSAQPVLAPEQPASIQAGPEQPGTSPDGAQPLVQPAPGSISGTVVDPSGAVVTGARIRLTGDDQSLNQEVLSGTNGEFSFANIAPGGFRLSVSSPGFAPQISSGTLHSGETVLVPQISLAVAGNISEVDVGLSRIDVAEAQIKVEEQQRVLGIVPNFYVTYIPNAAPLSSRQKFQLAWKTSIDPVTFLIVGAAAGVEQAQNHFNGYGQGAEGYAKRFGAGYADTVSGTFIGGAVLPSLLKQDPRYFYKGTGSIRSRFLYALAASLICKGDNGRWQPNYSNVLGNLASGGISNLYYPDQDRNGVGLTFENAAIGIGTGAVANLLQEFVIRKFTPKVPNTDPAKP